MSVGSPPQTPPPPSWLALFNPGKWPKWVLGIVAPVLFLVLVFYYRDQRVGNGIFAPEDLVFDIEQGVKGRVDHYGRTTVLYQDGSEKPADGFGLAIVTKDDDAKHPDRLHAYRGLIKDTDWPLVVFLNGTGFDATGEPICVRRAKDGGLLFSAKSPAAVALCVAGRDGSFLVYPAAGKQARVHVDEKTWVEKYMRLKYDDPKELEKLSDAELKKRGYERIVPKTQERPADKPAPKSPPKESLRILPLRPLPQEKK